MNNVNFIIAQILGLTTTIILCLSYAMKNKQMFLIVGFIGDVIYGTAFIFVESWSAGLIALLSCVQFLFFYHYEKKNKKMPIPLATIFAILFVIAGIVTWQSAMDIIPIAVYVWYTFVLYFDDVKTIRLMYIIPNLLFVFYDINAMAYTSALEDGTEVVCLTTLAIIEYVHAKKQSKALQTATLKNTPCGLNKGIRWNLQSIFHQGQTSINRAKAYSRSFLPVYLPHNKYLYPCLPHHWSNLASKKRTADSLFLC